MKFFFHKLGLIKHPLFARTGGKNEQRSYYKAVSPALN